jgi:hypothetical protein
MAMSGVNNVGRLLNRIRLRPVRVERVVSEDEV